MLNATRLKVQLKLSMNRLKMLQAKKTSLNQQQRREIATLIEKGKIESARVRVEHVIRDDLVIEAMESLELYSDLLLARFGLLEAYKTCEASISEAVHTLIWAAPRLGEVKELGLVRDQLASKFGKEFMLDAMENKDGLVNPKVIIKLEVGIPDTYLVERYLEEIASIYKIKWQSNLIEHDEETVPEDIDNVNDDDSNNDSGSGGQKEALPPLPAESVETQLDLPQIPSASPINKPSEPSNNNKTDCSNNEKSPEASIILTEEQGEVKEISQENRATDNIKDYRTTSIALIEKLLQFSIPRLDSKIVNVLFLEGSMMDILMSHITRLDLKCSSSISLSKCGFEEKIKFASHKRDTTDMNSLRRSYHAMELLSGGTANHLWVQNSKFYIIVNYLFNVFLPNSHGNFNHFLRIFQHFSRRNPCGMLEYVILRNDATILYDYMLPYITESSVVDSILGLIFIRDINIETRGQRERCHNKLQETKFLDRVLEAIQLTEHTKYSEAAQEFLIRVIEESSYVENSDVIFKSLNDDMIEVLVKIVLNSGPNKKRKRIIRIIKLLVESGILNTNASPAVSHGPLYLTSIKTRHLLESHLAELSMLIIKERGPKKDVNGYPLLLSDIEIIGIMFYVFSNMNEQKTQMLASINIDFWKILVHSFFEKSSNNVYHTLFYRILVLLISSCDETTMASIISETRLIERLVCVCQNEFSKSGEGYIHSIQTYLHQKQDNRGHSLLILNHLRLISDAHKPISIANIINSNTCYQSFLSSLKENTITQIRPHDIWKLDGPRPTAHIGPSPPVQVTRFSPYTGVGPLNSTVDDIKRYSIELGSEFASSLGFDVAIEKEDPKTHSKHLPRRNSDQSVSSSQSSESDYQLFFLSFFFPIKKMHSSDEEEIECPLCMEELDIADRNFRPCPCGYKICRFCWHHIRENLNGKCPACRREYSEQIAEFEPVSADEIQRIRREKKEKEREQKDMDIANRRHLANMRVVQKNLVYIIGLHPRLAVEETVRSNDYFGQFGKIAKVVINKRQIAPTSHANGATSMQPSAAVYVTYFKKDDATRAIHAVDGSIMAGRILRASFGTTKYCTYYLRNMSCPNPSCLYLHEPGEDADTISKEELATGKHRMRDQMAYDNNSEEEDEGDYSRSSQYSSPSISSSDFPPTSSNHKKILASFDDERPALPASASWGKNSTPGTPTTKNSILPERTLTSDAFGPPLSVAVAQQQQQQKQQLSPTTSKRKAEKKKRKEMLQKQRKEEEQQKVSIPGKQHTHEEEDDEEDEETEYLFDDITYFVLGKAFDEVCFPKVTKEEKPVGVSGLHEPSPDNSEKTLKLKGLSLKDDGISPLELLTKSMSIPKYTGAFNPFSHQIMRSNTNSLFDSPVRKHSRFGFAQF
ncbi:regulator of Vps4 activity in the MVB pathway-domain-containing protein [Sporodiniella umbellata]|nr:regulator of Vps4 activity in the MVB pathway-domain-containing protein [Sporodiniella umbellata]